TTSPGFLIGRGRNNRALATLKIAVFAPIPNASEKTATRVKVGLSAISLIAKRKSWNKAPIVILRSKAWILQQATARASKTQPQSELDRAGATDLVQPVEAAQLPSEHIDGFTEIRARQVILDSPEVGVVEQIKRLRAELYIHLLAQVKLPAQGKIDLPGG